MRWTVVIATKSLPAAKSRLVAATGDAIAHRRLVEAIRADTVRAVRASAVVARVLIVCDGPCDAAERDPAVLTLVQHAPGLNAALSEGSGHAQARWPRDAVAALVGDLPALRSTELDDALAIAHDLERAFVPDRFGTGTTMLTVTGGGDLQPQFGPASAARHARHADRLAAGPGLRHDVDTPADLDAAVALGVGVATAALLRDSRLDPRPAEHGGEHGIVSA